MSEATITPSLLQWARERAGLDSKAAAKGITTAERLESWEKGDAYPTFRQALKLAKKLHVPFGYFFLGTPPSETIPLPDLRTVAEAPGIFSADFIDAVYDTVRKQQWYREYREEEGARPLPFVGSCSADDNALDIAAQIRELLGINAAFRQSARDPEDFLRRLVSKAEAVGILVLRSGVVGNNNYRLLDAKEFQGFAISDELAPLAFVNANDWRAAQIFTLVHELAHVWIGKSGISNLEYRSRSDGQVHAVERVCDQVAAETLVPRQELAVDWQHTAAVDANLAILGRRYKVSQFVVLRRAYENDLVDRDQYSHEYGRLKAQIRPKGKGNKGGDFDATLLSRSSSTFTWALLTATMEGRVPYRDAARLLNVNVGTLDGIYKRLGMRATPSA